MTIDSVCNHHFKTVVPQQIQGGEVVNLYKQALDAGIPFDVLILDITIPGEKGCLRSPFLIV